MLIFYVTVYRNIIKLSILKCKVFITPFCNSKLGLVFNYHVQSCTIKCVKHDTSVLISNPHVSSCVQERKKTGEISKASKETSKALELLWSPLEFGLKTKLSDIKDKMDETK